MEAKMKQYKFLLKLKTKGRKKVFKEALGPRVIASQVVVFDAEAYEGAIAVALLRQEELLIQEFIEVQIEAENELGTL